MAAAASSAAASAAVAAGKEALTRISMPVKDAALEAAKRAKPQWHLVDAKDQVCVVVSRLCGVWGFDRLMGFGIGKRAELRAVPQHP